MRLSRATRRRMRQQALDDRVEVQCPHCGHSWKTTSYHPTCGECGKKVKRLSDEGHRYGRNYPVKFDQESEA